MKKPKSTRKHKPVPKPNRRDTQYMVGKLAAGGAMAGASLITGIPLASLGMTLLEFLVKPPAQKRILEYLGQVAQEIERLQLDLEALSHRQLFLTGLMQSVQIAMRSHQQEKLDALRTAVLNCAVPNYIEDDMALMFLHLIDVFGVSHMRVLNHVRSGVKAVYLDYTLEDERAEMYIITNQLKNKFPGDTFDAEFLVQIFKELSDHGLAVVREVTQTEEGEMPVKADITNLGEKFLDFITTYRPPE